jgi:hypothetical protein
VDVVAAPAPPVAPGPAAGGDGASPLTLALQAQQHAEHLQRQHATRQAIGLQEPALDPQQRQQVDAHVDAINGLSDHWKRFLKSHPSLLTPPYHQSMMHHYQLALSARVPDSSVQMDHAILQGVARDIEAHHELTAAHARPTVANHQAHQDATEAAAELQREAEQYLAAYQPAPTAPSPPRRSIPVQAPVSRDYPSVTGNRSQDRTLSADERQIARSSMPHLAPEQAEYQYLLNRQRMREMKADGRIQGDR